MQIGMGIGAGFAGPGVPRVGYERVVFVGASIMQQVFGQNLSVPNAVRTAAFRAAGLAVDVYGFGWSGFVVSNIREKLTQAMATFPTGTLFVVHIGGNNVSNTRPYSSASLAQKNALISDFTGLIADIGARKGDVILCPLTFRTYEAEPDIAALANPRNAVFENEALGSLPYNTNILIPAIAAWRPETINSDGNPVVDLYNATRNSYESYVNGGGDGVHPTSPVGRDYLAQVFMERLETFVNQSARPGPIVPRGLAPTNTDAPKITGIAQQGKTLTASSGIWTGSAPIAYAYQWQRNGASIAAAIGTTYVLTAVDVGAAITVSVTASNAAGSGSVASVPTGPVAGAATPPVNLTLPTIVGTAQKGQTLTAAPGSWSGTGSIEFTYRWNRDGAAIPGATAVTYVLVSADVNTAVTVSVTGTNSAGSAIATSSPTGAVIEGAAKTLVVNFGNTPASFGGTSFVAADVNGPTKPLTYDDGSPSPYSLGVTHPGTTINNDNYNNSVNTGQSTGVTAYDGSLFNNAVYASSLFTDMKSGPLTLVIGGLIPGASYELSFAGSRSAGGAPRIARFTDGSITVEYNAISNPPAPPASGVFLAGAEGMITLILFNPAGTASGTYAYVGGMRIATS